MSYYIPLLRTAVLIALTINLAGTTARGGAALPAYEATGLHGILTGLAALTLIETARCAHHYLAARGHNPQEEEC